MKVSTILASAVVVMTAAVAVTPASADSFDRRQFNQAKRIDQGVRSGSLTHWEAARLKAEQARIAHLERWAERDGRFSAAERARLAAAQRNASRNIYLEKHDNNGRSNRWSNRWSDRWSDRRSDRVSPRVWWR